MVLVLLAMIGLWVGYRLAMSRAGYLTMSLTALGFSTGQIVHLFVTPSREATTMLPLAAGIVLVLFMLLGALARWARGGSAKAT